LGGEPLDETSSAPDERKMSVEEELLHTAEQKKHRRRSKWAIGISLGKMHL
jgi:hypothetical protein